MAQSVQKITLSASRDIPFNKLLLSACNVRRVKAGVSIEQLADDIARRTLLQSLTVRPVLDAAGIETGMYEIPAGGRRFRALELLVKQKRLAKAAPIPCVIREGGIAEEDSLAENVQRAPLHPLDQFRAFLALREKGQSEEEIAAAFFVSVAVVKQRLRLASVSPKLLDVYAEDGLTLDQLMAFTVNGDHERQEQVFDRLSQSYTKEAYVIRRMLTEGAVRAADKRALFVGVEAYEGAGGTVMRDLFQGDDGGWLQDPGLIDQLVVEKLQRDAETVAAEGWKWIEVAPDFAYGHHFGLRQLRGGVVALSAEEEATRDALREEYDRLEQEYADYEDLPEEIDRRMTEIETMLGTLEDRPAAFDPEEVARAGAFVSIDGAGALKVERGYVRPEDELPIPEEPDVEIDAEGGYDDPITATSYAATSGSTVYGNPGPAAEPEEEDGIRPLPDRLLTELTTHRTLALRVALGEHRDVAFLAALHAFCLRVFYGYGLNTCLELDVKSVTFHAQAPGLNDTTLARTLAQRHQDWSAKLPKQPEDLWATLAGLGELSREALFAHCVGLSVNAVHEAYSRRPQVLAHADVLAKAVDLDMAAAGWTPTVDTYLGRVTKARILQAVREAKGEHAAQLIDHLKKGEMAEKAEALLAGSGWLAEPLRTPGRAMPQVAEVEALAATDVTGSEEAGTAGVAPLATDDGEAEGFEQEADEAHAFAAE
ncbi:ParB/RepB/Spo0J family partition protein [Rhodopila sp.]|uniref:ParB/RepB/Spo0J family partition protein n=1 Tax=Rhodopila sp. TaxID=2480087 RepID=UPI003D0B03D5